MVLKRKTMTKVVRAPKATLKANADVEENDEAETVARKMMKRPAGVAEKVQKEVDESEESESEEESEEEEEAVETKNAGKMLKKPAAAATKMDVDESEEEDSEEEEEDEEVDDEEEEQASGPAKIMKKPAAVGGKPQKKMDVDEESEEESEEEEEEDESEEEEEAATPNNVAKRPAAAAAKEKKGKEESEDNEEDSEAEEEDDNESVGGQIVPVEEKEVSEQDLLALRAKELKAMSAEDMKELVAGYGLQKGTKEVMIKMLLKHEAKLRAAAKEQKAKIRAVVIKKKQEFEALSIPELGKLCNEKGLKGLRSKPERVQRLLVQWQEDDGVDKALNEIAQDARKDELSAMDTTKLRKFCNKLGVDPFVKEVMVERISKHEHLMGSYARPGVKEEEKAPTEEKADMVEALLANEATRKKERDLKSKQEEELLRRRKELKALSIEDLKKRLAKKGLEATGKREDMLETLFIAIVQEDAAAARKAVLQSKSGQELKELLALNGLETGSKDQMVKTMLAYEAKSREDLKAFESKVDEEAAKRGEQLDSKPNAYLKELCASKGLPVKGDKEERIDLIIEEAKKEGEFDRVVSANIRNKRKEELMSIDKSAVLKMCEATGVDPFVKDIMVERIMSHESEAGEAIAATDAEQPAAKKARVSKK